ncbi:MAG: tetratricopeptide repeat protein [Candidatus Omnitrophota bacterium]
MKARSILKYTKILLFCAVILPAIVFYAEARTKPLIPSLFYKANEFFQQGKYEQAEKAYQEILDSGAQSGNIYYNLGNTFFKLGQVGKAIVNYERAKLLLPQDSDVQANLQYALSLCNNSVVPLKQNWFIGVLKNIAVHFTLDAWTRVLSVLYFLVLLFSAGFILTKISVFKKTAVCLAVGLGVISCIWFVKFEQTRLINNAIVIVAEIDSRFAPSDDAVVHFKAYEGAKIEIIDRNNAWIRIKTPDGKIGWVPASAVEKI